MHIASDSSLAPGKGAATTPMQSVPMRLPHLCSLLLRLVGLGGQVGDDNDDVDLR